MYLQRSTVWNKDSNACVDTVHRVSISLKCELRQLSVWWQSHLCIKCCKQKMLLKSCWCKNSAWVCAHTVFQHSQKHICSSMRSSSCATVQRLKWVCGRGTCGIVVQYCISAFLQNVGACRNYWMLVIFFLMFGSSDTMSPFVHVWGPEDKGKLQSCFEVSSSLKFSN